MLCGLHYKKVKKRIAEHVSAIIRGLHHYSGAVSHFVLKHNNALSSFSFYGIEHVTKPSRGGDWRRSLLNREAYWILRLKTWAPSGMNHRNDLLLVYLNVQQLFHSWIFISSFSLILLLDIAAIPCLLSFELVFSTIILDMIFEHIVFFSVFRTIVALVILLHLQNY